MDSVNSDGSACDTKEPEAEESSKESRRAGHRSWKNALALSVGWLLLYTGYFPMLSIQSSMNDHEGLGTLSLMVLNATEMVGNLFLSSLIIYKVGSKWSVVIGTLLMSAYSAANFYPVWATMAPMAGLAGFGVSLTWIAQNTYLTKISQYYVSHVDSSDYDTINIRFFGTFFAIFSSCNVIGNVASSFILGVGETMGNNDDIDLETYHHNGSLTDDDSVQLCGYDYCNEDLGVDFKQSLEDAGGATNLLLRNATHLHPHHGTDPSRVYFLCAFCLAASLVSTVVVTIFVDSLPKLKIVDDEAFSWKQVGSTFRHLANPNQLLLLPLSLYTGLDNDFLYSEFTKAFVTCPLGIEYIGFVTAVFGVMMPIMSFFCGWISSKHTRAIPFVIAGVAHLSCCVIMLNWKPVPGHSTPIYGLSSLWGIGTGVWSSQLTAYYGIIFPQNLEAAFSNLHLWNAVGSMILYASSHYVCTRLKTCIMIGVLSSGLVGYAIVLVRRYQQNVQKKKQPNATFDSNKSVILVKFIKQMATNAEKI